MRNNFDFTPLRRSSVGFDRLFDLLESGSTVAGDTYSPFDIEHDGGDGYRITLAVPGWRQDEIDITAKQNLLIVSGKMSDRGDRKYVHHGIVSGSFERRFALGDYVQVRGAELKDGLLSIELVREIPEEMKPRRIEIGRSGGDAITDQRTNGHSERQAA
jgi:molecular chaperone IbpA